MCKHARRWAVALVVLAAAAMVFTGTVHAAEAGEEQMLELFQQGVNAYKAGQYQKARDMFEEVLGMEPGMHAALKMRNRAELGVLFEMSRKEEMAPQAEELVELVTRAVRQRGREVEGPEQLIADLKSEDVEAFARATAELKAHGPYAVPYVVPILGVEDPEKQHVVGRAVALLGDMQRDACLPLIQALRQSEDPLVRSRVAGVLAQLDDERAVAALKAAQEDADAAAPVQQAAAEALQSLTGKSPAELAPAPEQYIELADAYLAEKAHLVGYTYGLTADVWGWEPAGAGLTEKLVYEEVPNYLYHQKMASEVALEGLKIDPANPELQAFLGASLARQLALCKRFEKAEFRLGGRDLTEAQQQEAAERAEDLARRAPIVLHLMEPPVLAHALELTVEVEDGPASLYLVKALSARLDAIGARPGVATADGLLKALESGNKDVRYNAAIALVEFCPLGDCGSATEIMKVVNATLNAAAERNALVLIDDFQTRNTLADLLRKLGVSTVETRVNEGSIAGALALEPAIDAVFISADAPELIFNRVFGMLREDPRTKGLPMYAVVGPDGASVDLGEYEGIEKVLSVDDIRAEKIKPIVEQTILAESRTAFTEEEEAVLLKAVRALAEVPPDRTQYLLSMLEPSLVSALRGYSDQVTGAAISTLASFGSPVALKPLSGIVERDAALELKVAACNAMAAVMRRTGATASEDVRQTLETALAADQQELRVAAAEALSAAGLSSPELLGLIQTRGLELD